MIWKQTSMSGWGRSSWASVRAARPETQSSLRAAALESGLDGVLARGAGRSYGDQAVRSGGRVILTERLNRFVEFDAETGRLVAEAGVTFNDLLDVFLPLGWMAPVTPGTAFVTLGGALANDVHGKNHDGDGSFGQHVEWFDLLTASGESLRVSPASHPDLFRATLGGMGLTGIVTALCLTLRKVPSATFAVTEERAPDLDGLMDLLAGARQTASHSVAWIDALARGKSLGRGVVETGRISPDQAKSPSQRRSLALPMDLPSLAMSAPLVAAFNHAYYHRIPEGGRRRLADSRSFLYPLDAISGWNRLYGKRGFHQFQCVIPEAAAPQAMRLLLETIAAARAASFLAVLKTLGEEGAGFLSFPMRGWSLALDFPARSGVVDLLARLEAITIDHGGRIYLAKDSVMAPASLDRMYPRLERLRRVLAQIDPHGHWQSDMARRLMIRGAA